ncbi:hypothetical protein QR46_1484 [Giardia duodenalis assemblage B]|uniref:DUF676 domain-containing protein n=3 Tax=Giardia intestinalis TaxID=5741 RepID=A0A132NWS5_GIAIN|nr:Hypothetical protein GL50581_3792 [Giardia intestinalis ATCC 50581]ESU42548.1 Hypothetical protein GSB_14104 [Giardia intestinalis]KWX14520.1 hypothetical protein QR46_1484 [Giardia intestinalis assemblage B]
MSKEKSELNAYCLQVVVGSLFVGYNAPRGYYVLKVSVKDHRKIKYVAVSSIKSFLLPTQTKDCLTRYKVTSQIIGIEQNCYHSEPFYIHEGNQTIHFNTILTFTVGSKNRQISCAVVSFKLYYVPFPKEFDSIEKVINADESQYIKAFDQSLFENPKLSTVMKRRCYLDNFCVPFAAYHIETFNATDNFKLECFVCNFLTSEKTKLMIYDMNGVVSESTDLSDNLDDPRRILSGKEDEEEDNAGKKRAEKGSSERQMKRFLNKSRVEATDISHRYNSLKAILYDICGCTVEKDSALNSVAVSVDNVAVTPLNIAFVLKAAQSVYFKMLPSFRAQFYGYLMYQDLKTMFQAPDAHNDSYYTELACQYRKTIKSLYSPQVSMGTSRVEERAEDSDRSEPSSRASSRSASVSASSGAVGVNPSYGNIPYKPTVSTSSVVPTKSEVLDIIMQNRKLYPYVRPEKYVIEAPIVFVRSYTQGSAPADDKLTVASLEPPVANNVYYAVSSNVKSARKLLSTDLDKINVYVYLHGLQAQYLDMIAVSECLATFRKGKSIDILCESYADSSAAPAKENASKIYNEIFAKLSSRNVKLDSLQSINFIGHSLGGLLCLKVASMLPADQQEKLGFLLTINAPIAGTTFKSNLVSMAVPFITGKMPIIKEIKDCSSDGVIYATATQFPNFKQIYFVGTCGDGFVPFRCATGMGITEDQMTISNLLAQNIKSSVVKQAIVCFDPVELKENGTGLNNIIGRTAHLRLLADRQAFRMVLEALGF